MTLRYLLASSTLIVALTAAAPVKEKFSAAEMQQISIETPGLFSRSNAFSVDFSTVNADAYCFPLPVGKAKLVEHDAQLEISSAKGDAVKAMFDGEVRLSRNHPTFGNIIVIRHRNGLETVYGNNAQNLVKVGQAVKAGQTIAIVGTKNGITCCTVAIMVNGARINPSTILSITSHKLRKQTIMFEKKGKNISVTVLVGDGQSGDGLTLDPDEAEDPFVDSPTFKLNLEEIAEGRWAYPLPNAKVISPYGGKRRHSGVDLKTKPKDEIVAAFDGVVTRSCPYSGYGNCIVIKHAYGFETLYSHQFKNIVKVGEKVKAGQVIGLTGRTGRATTEHLHFEVIYKGRRLNPNIMFDHANHSLRKSTLTLSKTGKVTSSK